MFRQLSLLFGLLLGFIFTISADSMSGDYNVYINGKKVDANVVKSALNRIMHSSPMLASQLHNKNFMKQVLQSIAMQQVILMEGKKLDLESTAAYKDKLMQFKPIIEAQILEDRAASTITADDVLHRYQVLKKQNDNRVQYHVSNILVKDLSTANMVIKKLNHGDKFADLAKKYSIDAGSSKHGGDLGWSDGTNYVPEFMHAVTMLGVNHYTKSPVKSHFGYHVILLQGKRKGGSFPSYDQMKAQIMQNLRMMKTRDLFQKLKSDYKVEVK